VHTRRVCPAEEHSTDVNDIGMVVAGTTVQRCFACFKLSTLDPRWLARTAVDIAGW
jgi:hypothetical protein